MSVPLSELAPSIIPPCSDALAALAADIEPKFHNSRMNVCSGRPLPKSDSQRGCLNVLPRAYCGGSTNVGQDAVIVEASMLKADEWDLLKRQFEALVHDKSVDAESIEEIFDVQFRRRFTELITQTAQGSGTSAYNWPRR